MEDEYVTDRDLVLTLFQRIRSYRLAMRLSQKALSEKSGVGLSTISHLEQGEARNLTVNNLVSLLRVFGMQERLPEVLPELPIPPIALKTINKYIPKRIKRRKEDKL